MNIYEEEKEKMNEQKNEEKAKALKALKGQMVSVNVTLFKPYYDFIKDYVQFFGSERSVAEICRMMIYANVNSLYQSLGAFVKDELTHVEKGAWFEKHSHIACVSFPEEKEENE